MRLSLAGGILGTHKRFIEHHLSYFLPTFYMLSDWIFILFVRNIMAVSAQQWSNGQFRAAHCLAPISGLYSPSFYFIFTGRAVYQKPMGIWRLLETYFLRLCLAICLIILQVYLTHIGNSTSRLFIAFLGIFSFLFLSLSRLVMTKSLTGPVLGAIQSFLLGPARRHSCSCSGIKDDVGLNYHVIGYVDDAGERKENVGNLPYLGTLDEIEPILTKTQVNDVFHCRSRAFSKEA